jgi:hypothetical protein
MLLLMQPVRLRLRQADSHKEPHDMKLAQAEAAYTR